MRIHNAYTLLDRPTRTDATTGTPDAKGRANGAGGTARPGEVSTSVALSPRARELSAQSDPSAARVSALREQIQRGELRIDANAIAAKLIGDDA